MLALIIVDFSFLISFECFFNSYFVCFTVVFEELFPLCFLRYYRCCFMYLFLLFWRQLCPLEEFIGNAIRHFIVVSVRTSYDSHRRKGRIIFVAAILVCPYTKTGEGGGDSRYMERHRLQWCVSPWFVIRWEYCYIHTDE